MRRALYLCFIILLVLSGITTSFASESANASDAAVGASTSSPPPESTVTIGAVSTIVPDMKFTGEPIKLSLEDAYKKILNDSPGKTVAEYNKKDAIAISNGYVDSIQLINEGIDAGIGGKKTREIQRALRDYAKQQAEPNYQAELNKLKVDTLTKYYQLKNLEDLEKIATETLSLKEKLLTNTQLKYKLGTVANSDVLQAESEVNGAKDALFIAQNNLRGMKMAFNTFMGYEVMQNVVLTDSLKQSELPAKSLESSIKDALTNRNDIKGAEFGLKAAKLNFDLYSDYPTYSSKYIRGQIAVLEAEKGLKDAYSGIEMDVRQKYMDLQQKYAAIKTGIKTVENAKEGLRLTQLQYDAGMATLTTVNEAQIRYNQSQVSLANNLLEYNLAIDAYNYVSGVGTTVAPIQ